MFNLKKMALIATLVAFAQCNKVDFSKPESVAMAYQKAWLSGDVEALRQFTASKDQKNVADIIMQSPKMQTSELKELKDVYCELKNDKAICTLCCLSAVQKVSLLKENDKWLVFQDVLDFDKPETVAVAFSKAIGNLDYSTAAKFCTSETGKLIETLGTMSAAISEEQKRESRHNAKFIESAKCTTEANKAKCIVCCDKDGEDSPESVDLKKENGRWLVHIDKSSGTN